MNFLKELSRETWFRLALHVVYTFFLALSFEIHRMQFKSAHKMWMVKRYRPDLERSWIVNTVWYGTGTHIRAVNRFEAKPERQLRRHTPATCLQPYSQSEYYGSYWKTLYFTFFKEKYSNKKHNKLQGKREATLRKTYFPKLYSKVYSPLSATSKVCTCLKVKHG